MLEFSKQFQIGESLTVFLVMTFKTRVTDHFFVDFE